MKKNDMKRQDTERLFMKKKRIYINRNRFTYVYYIYLYIYIVIDMLPQALYCTSKLTVYM